MTDRVPGAPGQYILTVSAAEAQKILTGEPVVVTLKRDDQPLVEGTPYNKQSVLPDDIAEIICPDNNDPTPADAFAGLLAKRYVIILGEANWIDNQQTVLVPSVTADPDKTDVFASPATQDDNFAAYIENGVRLYAQNDGSVVFKCDSVPDVSITVNLAVRV